MSAAVDLITAIRARITSDTGSGGLLETNGSASVTACYSFQAPQIGPTLPYMVILPVSNVEIKSFSPTSGYAEEFLIQFSIFTDKDSGATRGGSIAKRLRARLDRWAPNLSANGWSASELLREDGQMFVEEDNYHTIEQYRVLLADA